MTCRINFQTACGCSHTSLVIFDQSLCKKNIYIEKSQNKQKSNNTKTNNNIWSHVVLAFCLLFSWSVRQCLSLFIIESTICIFLKHITDCSTEQQFLGEKNILYNEQHTICNSLPWRWWVGWWASSTCGSPGAQSCCCCQCCLMWRRMSTHCCPRRMCQIPPPHPLPRHQGSGGGDGGGAGGAGGQVAPCSRRCRTVVCLVPPAPAHRSCLCDCHPQSWSPAWLGSRPALGQMAWLPGWQGTLWWTTAGLPARRLWPALLTGRFPSSSSNAPPPPLLLGLSLHIFLPFLPCPSHGTPQRSGFCPECFCLQ